ncbi:actin bundling protein [Naegleria gruberi]|uniref:Actin bundling protein n=1 Tax=Naegleria gruberi TaxID=5762 RepID=D2VCL8_NAEGR|nr:actin bundling protein [Naegleria gruberi]EFC45441.1 actin bundling protein [Naegleria gruberi]|eukprot:XP_002678185.1 actin bundling protein [Naegleria gruberi strain NEG-M]
MSDKLNSSANVVSVGVSGGTGHHGYTEEETEAFTDYINSTLMDDQDLKDKLPIAKDGLFEAVKDGVLINKLINTAVPGTVDERVINKKPKMNPWERNENHELAINSAKAIGCRVVNIQAGFIDEGRPHIVLGLVWQIIKIGLLSDINLKNHPELVRLLQDGESLADLLKLDPAALLVRWVNYHLKNAGSDRRIKNLEGDIKDSVAYTLLLTQIAPNGECSKDPLNENDLEKRAEKMLQNADKIGCRKFVRPKEVINGNQKLNLAFVANLFNNYPALEPINLNDYADLLNFDMEGTREERAFKFWIQSLDIDCNAIPEDLRDGVVLLKVFDKVKPGCVEWKRVSNPPKNRYQAIENTNYCVDLAKQFKFNTVNVGGTDIADGNKKIILGLIWQLMRRSLLDTLKALGGGKEVDEKDVVAWANSKVTDEKPIDDLNDKSLRTGVFLCKLCAAVRPSAVNLDFITPGESDEDAEQNAKYAISVARKIGATVFLLFEDILEVKPRMILSFIASLWVKSLNK